VPHPVVFAVPADVELHPAPIPPHWVTEGNPQARSKRLGASADGTASIMAWSCTPGRFTWRYRVDEVIHILSGEIFVTDENGQRRRLGPGDMVFFPAGSVSDWHVTEEVRKLAVCRHSMPRPLGFALRAWNKLVAMLANPGEAADPLASQPGAAVERERVTAA
jgi:hypothetical protein